MKKKTKKKTLPLHREENEKRMKEKEEERSWREREGGEKNGESVGGGELEKDTFVYSFVTFQKVLVKIVKVIIGNINFLSIM